MCCGWKSRAEPRLRSGLTLKFYKFQSRHSGEKRCYRCCRSPYGSVVANGDGHLGCLRPLRRNPRRVALDACTPFGLQARPYGRRAALCAAIEPFQSEIALSRQREKAPEGMLPGLSVISMSTAVTDSDPPARGFLPVLPGTCRGVPSGPAPRCRRSRIRGSPYPPGSGGPR